MGSYPRPLYYSLCALNCRKFLPHDSLTPPPLSSIHDNKAPLINKLPLLVHIKAHAHTHTLGAGAFAGPLSLHFSDLLLAGPPPLPIPFWHDSWWQYNSLSSVEVVNFTQPTYAIQLEQAQRTGCKYVRIGHCSLHGHLLQDPENDPCILLGQLNEFGSTNNAGHSYLDDVGRLLTPCGFLWGENSFFKIYKTWAQCMDYKDQQICRIWNQRISSFLAARERISHISLSMLSSP